MAQNNNASRVQVTLTSPDAIKAWGQVPRGLKAKALEQAILQLQKNKTFAPMFFSETADTGDEVEEKKQPSKRQTPKQSSESQPQTKPKSKVVEEW